MAIRRLVSLVVVLGALGCASLSLPPVGSVIGGPEPIAYPDAGAVVMEDVATLEYRVMPPPKGGKPQLLAVLDHRRKIKILTRAGLSEAQIRLPVDGYSTITRVVGRSIAEGRNIVTLNPDSITVRERMEVEARADEVKDLTFEIPGAQVGGLIEYRYERIYLDPLWIEPWVYASRLPVLRSEFGVVSDPNVQVDLRHGAGDHGIDRKPVRRDTLEGGRTRIVFVEADLPGMFAEAHGVNVAHRAPWTALAVRQARLPQSQVARWNDWSSIAAHVRQSMRLKGQSTFAPHGEWHQRIGEVRAQTVPLAVNGLGVQRPDQSRNKSAKSPICYREAAARALDTLGTTPLLFLTGPAMPPFAEDFPSAYPFSRVVLELPAQAAWLKNLRCDGPPFAHDLLCGVRPGDGILFDPACPDCPLGTLAPGYAETRALRVEPNGETRWVDVHGGGPGLHALVQNVTLTMDVDGSLRGAIKERAKGSLAGAMRERLRHVGRVGGSRVQQDEQVGRFNAQMLFGDGEAPRADGIRLINLYDAEQPLLAQAEVLGQAQKTGFETFSVRALDLVGSSVPSYWQGARQGAVVLGGPWWLETTCEVNLPVGYVAVLPQGIARSDATAEYAAGFAQVGRKLYFTRRLVIKQAAIASEDWASFHDVFDAIRSYEKQPVALEARK